MLPGTRAAARRPRVGTPQGRIVGTPGDGLGDRATPKRECRDRRMFAYGGGGNDRIGGTKGGDVLRGGAGKSCER